MTKVLVFESDSDFAQTLTEGLAAYGCAIQVVEDGEEGINEASKSAPDLILLTIELPRMNGFSVCNKLKRNKDLKQVPLVLLSSEATEETFEQHKRLRTRADVYVHKPITVDELVARIGESETGGALNLRKSGEPEGEGELDADDIEEVSLDDDIEMEDVPDSTAAVEEETDEAFGNLMAPAPEPPPATDVEMEDLELDEGDGLEIAPEEPSLEPEAEQRVSLDPVPAPHVPEVSSEELLALRAEIAQLSADLKSAREATEAEADAKAQVISKKDAEIELAEKELEQLRAKLSSNEGAGTAREFLDLREQLNKKDKEILQIRDSLTSKEKEVIRLNEENIALGREKADLTDQVSSLEQEKSELQKMRDALSADKEQAAKRGDDYKAKSERLQAELDARTSELKSSRESFENMVATRDAQDAAMRDDHATALREAAAAAEQEKQAAISAAIQQAEEAAAAEREAALVAAAEEAKRAEQLAVAARETEMKAEQDSKMAALHRANEESLRKLRAEHEQASEEAEQAAKEQLAIRERELGAEGTAALQAQQAQSDSAYAELESRRASLEQELATTVQDRDSANATITQRDQKIEELEAKVAAARADGIEIKDQLERESALLAQARQKWSEDSAALNEAKAALQTAAQSVEASLNRVMP